MESKEENPKEDAISFSRSLEVGSPVSVLWKETGCSFSGRILAMSQGIDQLITLCEY